MRKVTVQSYLVVLSVLVALGVVVGMFLTKPLSVERRLVPGMEGADRSLVAAVPQRGSERAWREIHFKRIATLRTTPGTSLVLPLLVKTDAAGNVFVLDWGDRKIKQFSSEGVFRTAYGNGSGKGPGEFTNITDFDLGPDGTVWVCDPMNGVITVFHGGGVLAKTIRPVQPPYRLALLEGGDFLTISAPTGRTLFTRYRENGTIVRQFGTFMENQERMGVTLDGRMARVSSGDIAFAGYRAGIVLVYDSVLDSLRVVARTVVHGGFPAVVVRTTAEAEYIRVDPESPLITRSISAVGAEVHLLAGGDAVESGKAAFDVYDAGTGAYRFSYRFPEDPVSASVTGTHVYSVRDTLVSIWARETATSP